MTSSAEEQCLLKTIDIPLIITSTTSSPDTMRKDLEKKSSSKAEEKLRGSSIDGDGDDSGGVRKKSMDGTRRRDSKGRNVGGSLKYEIGRNKSASNLIDFPAKWSSVRIKGTGYHDSRKSIVKIEPCNGIPNMAKEYTSLKSPNHSTGQMKPHIGNVSRDVDGEQAIMRLYKIPVVLISWVFVSFFCCLVSGCLISLAFTMDE